MTGLQQKGIRMEGRKLLKPTFKMPRIPQDVIGKSVVDRERFIVIMANLRGVSRVTLNSKHRKMYETLRGTVEKQLQKGRTPEQNARGIAIIKEIDRILDKRGG